MKKEKAEKKKKSRRVMTAEGLAKYGAAVRVIKQSRSSLLEIEWDDSVPGMGEANRTKEAAYAKLTAIVLDYESRKKSFGAAEKKRQTKADKLKAEYKALTGTDIEDKTETKQEDTK